MLDPGDTAVNQVWRAPAPGMQTLPAAYAGGVRAGGRHTVGGQLGRWDSGWASLESCISAEIQMMGMTR